MATSDKYDRQLRVWGPNGQRALMESSVLLVNADAAGSETLKNLVLPGIGNFTILDENVRSVAIIVGSVNIGLHNSQSVSETDVGSNFFVSPSSIGKPRANVTDNLSGR
jgi:amyloid beta precursor protein binding protein 1